MKLAVDTHHLLVENAGTKRVTLNLLRQLRTEPEIELFIVQPSYPLKFGSGIPGKMLGHILRFFWVHIQLPLICLFKGIDFLLSPEYYTPMFLPCRKGVIAHDANIRVQKNFVNPLWFRFYYIPFIEPAIRKADLIFSVSEFSKQEIVRSMKIRPEKVQVVYNGVDPIFSDPGAEGGREIIEAKGLEAGKYILFIGTFEARKNIERLIQAFAILKEREIGAGQVKLAIVGKPASGRFSDRNRLIRELIREKGLEREVILCGFVPDHDLPAFYRNALTLAFPSLYEGFGLPIIEGFASGIPVLTSNTSAMKEVAGGACMLVDPYDVEDIVLKLSALLSDRELRDSLVGKGLQRVELFAWKNFSDKILYHIKRGAKL